MQIPYVLIRPSSEEPAADEEREAVPLVSTLPDLAGKEKEPVGPIEAIMARTTPRNRRIFGFVLALVAGLCYGSNFDPPMVRSLGHRLERSARCERCTHTRMRSMGGLCDAC